jgi:hypothetical protein
MSDSVKVGTGDGYEMDERDVRLWFMKTELEQAEDTFRVVEGIIQTRKEFQPKRKRRSDADKPKSRRAEEGLLPGV